VPVANALQAYLSPKLYTELFSTRTAMGALASSLTENQIVAAAISFGALLLFWVIGWSSQFAVGGAGRLLSHLSLLEHFDSFPKGIIDTKDVMFFLNFMVFCLYVTLRSLESHRWRG